MYTSIEHSSNNDTPANDHYTTLPVCHAVTIDMINANRKICFDDKL